MSGFTIYIDKILSLSKVKKAMKDVLWIGLKKFDSVSQKVNILSEPVDPSMIYGYSKNFPIVLALVPNNCLANELIKLVRRLKKKRMGIPSFFVVVVVDVKSGKAVSYDRFHHLGNNKLSFRLKTSIDLERVDISKWKSYINENSNNGKRKSTKKRKKKKKPPPIDPIEVDSTSSDEQVKEKKKDVDQRVPKRGRDHTGDNSNHNSNERKRRKVDQNNAPVPSCEQTHSHAPAFSEQLRKVLKLKNRYMLPSKLHRIELKFLERVCAEVVSSEDVGELSVEDVFGLEEVKENLKKSLVLPLISKNKSVFTGLLAPENILLFGPPGTGKTMLIKAIAGITMQSGTTFFNIAASSITSKFVGEGEATVKALFEVARHSAPSIIFIDELDSILMKRTDDSGQSLRRIKTEFLIQLDGLGKNSKKGEVIFIGATNYPQSLDTAIIRRFGLILYVPLPNRENRVLFLKKTMINQKNKNLVFELSDSDLGTLSERLEGFSGSDLVNLIKTACRIPLDEFCSNGSWDDIQRKEMKLRPIVLSDFLEALKVVRRSVPPRDVAIIERWKDKFG